MKTHHSYTVPCALFLISVCLIIRYLIGRRKFNRSGMAGLQGYNNYNRAVATTFLEKMMLFIANLCGVAGMFLLAVAGFNHLKLKA